MNSKNTSRGISALLVIIAIAVVVGLTYTGGKYLKKTTPPDQVITENIDTPKPSQNNNGTDENAGALEDAAEPLEVNFSTGGMIFDENRKTGVKEWTFLYDEPGRLAIDVKLIFTDQSMCALDGPEKACDMDNFDWTKYAEDTYFDLEGHKEGNEVTVVKLILNRMSY